MESRCSRDVHWIGLAPVVVLLQHFTTTHHKYIPTFNSTVHPKVTRATDFAAVHFVSVSASASVSVSVSVILSIFSAFSSYSNPSRPASETRVLFEPPVA